MYSAEVAKTRLQLQGELQKRGGQKIYNNAIDAIVKTWRNEGLRGLQRGLAPAVRTYLVASCILDIIVADIAASPQYLYQASSISHVTHMI